MMKTKIPIVIIGWNNLYFVKRFIQQIRRFQLPIIVLDNNSTYQPLLTYYDDIKKELGENITINLLPQNYGHSVYKKLQHLLPTVYVLSDPDLQLNTDMPLNFDEHLLNISNSYKAYKVGLALDISDSDKFIEGEYGKLVYKIEKNYYTKPIVHSDYELYAAPTDTTFCLINNNYMSQKTELRVGGVFKAKHLPWYHNYLRDNIPQDELKVWITNNKSSSILQYIDHNSLLI